MVGLYSEFDRRSPLYPERHIYGDDYIYQLDVPNVGLWQIPKQIAGYLIKLIQLDNVTSFLEIGTCRGATTTVIAIYLTRFGLQILDTINVLNELPEGLEDMWKNVLKLPINAIIIDKNNIDTIRYRNNSLSRIYYDAVFIDGHHDYEYVKQDYMVYKEKTNRLAFHDVNDYFCIDVRRLWNEIQEEYSSKNDLQINYTLYTFTYHSYGEQLMGIGLIHRNTTMINMNDIPETIIISNISITSTLFNIIISNISITSTLNHSVENEVEIKQRMFNMIQNIPNIRKFPLIYIFEDLRLQHKPNTLWLEFGVNSGKTIDYISKYTDETVYGFDSFLGLPEKWRDGYDQGSISRYGVLPDVNKNVELIVGWFNETLVDFIKHHHAKKVSFIHMDADLYSSTKCVLNQLKDYIDIDCVIVFDKLLNYPGYDGSTGELKAFYEFITENKVDYEWLGMHEEDQGEAVAVMIHSIE